MADRLAHYHAKRDFSRTSEPRGDERPDDAPSSGTFVVQEHHARRLHYDVRFEVDGVMPSWAVPKGPSADPKVKRLAVQTEDHPLDYQDFEGTIPKGEYGGGSVVVWDRGTYRDITSGAVPGTSMRAAIEAGHFSVWIEGEKLHGGWSFTRTGRDGGKDQWIMVKRADAHASDVDLTAQTRSVISDRTAEEVAGAPDAPTWTREVATWEPPMLATLARSAPVEAGWVYERKLDGLRCIAVRNGDEVHLWSRNHLPFDSRFPEIIDALRALPADRFVLDGEIVAWDGDRTSFGLLQRGGPGVVATYCIFDVLQLMGRSVRALTYEQRRSLLAQAVDPVDPIRLVDVLEGEVGELLASACRDGWEGLIAKRAAAPYVTARSNDWRKLKCTASQELVIGGWTDPRGARSGFGALLVGYYDGSALRYAGKVGTGFDGTTLRALGKDLADRGTDVSPFADPVRERGAHWCLPELVAAVGFTEWTGDGKLRHPRFEGLRPDKDPRTVVRERPS